MITHEKATDKNIITKQVVINTPTSARLLPITADEKVIDEIQQALNELERLKKQEKLLEKLAERDTPMLPIKLKWNNTENYYYVCPKCEEMVARDDEVFCQDCGQRIDWEEEIK